MVRQFQAFYTALASQISSLAFEYIPRIGHGLIIIIMGWLAATLGRKIVQIALRAVGIDVFLGRLGVSRLLEQGKITRKPSQLAGALFYGLTWFLAVLMALDVLGLETASLLLENLVSYLPRLITSLIMLGLGLYAVDFITDLLKEIYLPNRPSLTPTIVAITRWGLTLLVVLAVMEHLGIARSLVTLVLATALGGTALTLVLAFGVGGIDTAKNMLAGHSLRRHITRGDYILWNGEKMQVLRISLTVAELDRQGEILLVPNALLLSDVLRLPVKCEE
ncbi:MAG: hypothetical protein GX986_00345 [Firmicutes bacterium]|nr:hypothetical protein [Bacillota bacterium]